MGGEKQWAEINSSRRSSKSPSALTTMRLRSRSKKIFRFFSIFGSSLRQAIFLFAIICGERRGMRPSPLIARYLSVGEACRKDRREGRRKPSKAEPCFSRTGFYLQKSAIIDHQRGASILFMENNTERSTAGKTAVRAGSKPAFFTTDNALSHGGCSRRATSGLLPPRVRTAPSVSIRRAPCDSGKPSNPKK